MKSDVVGVASVRDGQWGLTDHRRILCVVRVPPPSPEFEQGLAALGIELEPADRERLAAYLERLYDANERMNLTRVPPDAAWMRHVFDSLTLAPWLASIEPAAPESRRILDVGSGGGLPGVVLAIVLPSIVPQAGAHVTLLEATGKKARFLDETVAALALDPRTVDVVNDRAETAAHDRERHRERYDAVVARAVGALPVLVELTLPFVRPGGFAMFIKGERAPQELEEAKPAIGLLGGAFVETAVTPTGTLVRLEKVSRTPRIYPRPPGEPARVPIAHRKDRANASESPRSDANTTRFHGASTATSPPGPAEPRRRPRTRGPRRG